MKILFPENKYYNDHTYECGKVYEISEKLGFAQRWLRRGCQEVADFKGVVLKDPSAHVEELKPEIKVELPKDPIAPVVSPIVEDHTTLAKGHSKGKTKKANT
jgi:hypothetical protein